MNVESEKISVPQFINIFRRFSKSDQLKIAERINKQTFAERWQMLDAELPNVEMSDEEIMDEIKTVRDGRKTNR